MSFMSFMSFLLESVQQDLSLNKNLNLSTCMYIINIIHHGKCMRTVFTQYNRWFVSEISLVRCAHLFDFR